MKRSLAILCTLALAALAAAMTAGPARAAYRLDKVVVPTAESVTLKLDADQPEYSGSVRIELKASAAADSFQLNVRNLKIATLSLASSAGAVPATYHDAPFERITVVPAKKLAPGTYTLDIAFTNAFDVKATGLYRTKFGDDWYAFTQFESVDARQAFPCWDEPEFKIPWRLTLTVPNKHTAFANTPVEDETDKEGQRTFVYKTTRPLPSYLVAFTTGPLEVVNIPGMSVPGMIVTVRAEAARGRSGKMTPPILAALEEYFKRPTRTRSST
jgi:alanyl aminopeptidase